MFYLYARRDDPSKVRGIEWRGEGGIEWRGEGGIEWRGEGGIEWRERGGGGEGRGREWRGEGGIEGRGEGGCGGESGRVEERGREWRGEWESGRNYVDGDRYRTERVHGETEDLRIFYSKLTTSSNNCTRIRTYVHTCTHAYILTCVYH